MVIETLLQINSFNKLDIETQKEIQDFISGLTTAWEIKEIEIIDCDFCSNPNNLELKKIYGDDFVLNVCSDCYKNYIGRKNGK